MTSKFTRHYFPELLALSFRRKRPSMVTVNLTSRCNQRCIYCEIGQYGEKTITPELTFEDLNWILDEMAREGIGKISLCGGEPFLFSDLMKVIDRARLLKIRCSVTTNGMNVRFLSSDDLAILKESGTEVNISIDSFNNEINSFTRGNSAALENVLESLRVLREWHIPVTVLTVITRYNYRHLYQFFIEAYEKGIKQVLFQPVIRNSNYAGMPAIEDKAQLNPGPEETRLLMEQLRRILRFERKYDIRTNVWRFYPWINYYLNYNSSHTGEYFFEQILGKFYCREVDAIIDITYDGGIQPCGLLKAKTSVKNRNGMTLMGLWHEATSELKSELADGKFRPECDSCCHHFSRNMLASAFRYPLQNRNILAKILPIVIRRGLGRSMRQNKQINFNE